MAADIQRWAYRMLVAGAAWGRCLQMTVASGHKEEAGPVLAQGLVAALAQGLVAALAQGLVAAALAQDLVAAALAQGLEAAVPRELRPGCVRVPCRQRQQSIA